MQETARTKPISITSQMTKSIPPTVMAPLTVRNRTHPLSRTIACNAFAAAPTRVATPPYRARSVTRVLDRGLRAVDRFVQRPANHGHHVALIGKNGIGKVTVLIWPGRAMSNGFMKLPAPALCKWRRRNLSENPPTTRMFLPLGFLLGISRRKKYLPSPFIFHEFAQEASRVESLPRHHR